MAEFLVVRGEGVIAQFGLWDEEAVHGGRCEGLRGLRGLRVGTVSTLNYTML